MPSRHSKRLFQTLTVGIVDEPGEAVHHTLRGMENAQYARRISALREVMDDLLADRDGPGRELDPVGIPWVDPMSMLFLEAEGSHRAIDSTGEAGWDEIEIVGCVLVVGVDRDCRAAR